jgi:alpha-L-fucosidase
MAAFSTNTAPPATWDNQVRLWAADAVGRWANGELDLDISKKIDAAAQYRLRFVSEAGGPLNVADAVVLLDGIPQPALLRPEKGRSDAFILTMPGIGQRVRIRAVVHGAKSGDILLQKL